MRFRRLAKTTSRLVRISWLLSVSGTWRRCHRRSQRSPPGTRGSRHELEATTHHLRDGCGYAKARCRCRERELLQHIRAHDLPEPEREYPFALPQGRTFRADLAYPSERLLIEGEGGIYGTGGHNSLAGITRDVEKGNLAMLHGWRLLRCTSEHVRSGQCVLWIREALGMPEDEGEVA